ncbi:hypothetical protein M378DRAFT_9532 [Amanita muscaria Koide BX008]|uniref:Uncharacterized protein n=1 Tax=Amanita muscaria (strain Koide BX008) TaxID=946122 RepID=A0A0C2XEN6_AMAMK|nr:hypothetical protein M378DRAFT_9532 [Amanita muscaria Koide BX008]
MKLNYVLLPEGYIPTPPPADTGMDVDEVPMGEPMEVDDVEVRPKQRVVRVTVDVVVPAGELMGVDSVPAQRWPVLPRPAWNIDAADYQRWPVLPRPAWNVDMADYAKISPALIVGGTRVSRSPRKPSPRKTTEPQRSAPPSSSQLAKPVVSAPPHVDMSKLATSSKVKLEGMPVLFASVETSSSSLNVAHQVKYQEPNARCIRKTRFSSPLSPVKQSKIDDNLFLTSNRQSPDLITNDRWLKSSRTPGRNLHNESVFEGYSDADHSRLGVASPPTQDAETLFPEIKRFSPVKDARMDEDFFLRSNRQTPDLAVNNRWLKISRTPEHNIYNEPIMVEDDDGDYSSLCMGYPPSEDTEDSLPELDFAEADTSLNWAPGILTPQTPHRIRRTTLFSPLSPGRQSKLDEDDVFITSKRQTADLVSNNGWLRTSHTPGNIDNESVFYDNEYTDYSYLALAYPLVEDSDTSLNEDYSSTSTSLVSGTSGYLADDSFSFFDASYSSSSSLASDGSFGYLADVSCSSFADISETFDASRASMADEQTSHPSCETVSEAASRTDLSSSTSMDLLIATMSNLVIDEGSDLPEEGISAADNERTISEDSVAWQTAEETVPRSDSGDAADESFGEEGSEATQSDHDKSTEEDCFDSHYPSSLLSGNQSSYSCSASVNISGINLGVSSGSAGSGTETELLEDVGSLAVEEFRWEYDEPEEAHENEEEEDQSGNGNQLLAELAADAEVNDEDEGLLECHDLFERGTQTELDVDELEDDLKYIYTLPY